MTQEPRPSEPRRSEAPGSSARLEWTLKRSFIEYAAAIPDFQIYVSDGAQVEVRASEVLVWPAVERDDLTQGELRFQGSIELVGYQGMMDVRLREPRILATTEGGLLSVGVRDESGQEVSREVFAELFGPECATGSASQTWQARVTPWGSEMLGGVYPAGTVLDPIVIHGQFQLGSPPKG